jgi:hypothetical protein
MTISYEAFDKIVDGKHIEAMWNNDGTIMILQYNKGYKTYQEGSDTRSATLKPKEIETLLEKNSFQYSGIRPGLLPLNEKIEASIVNDIVSIKRTSMFFGDVLEQPEFSFKKSTLEDIFHAAKKVWEKQRESIRPLTGLNCKAGSFDAMEGRLDQDKINENQRSVVAESLAKWHADGTNLSN